MKKYLPFLPFLALLFLLALPAQAALTCVNGAATLGTGVTHTTLAFPVVTSSTDLLVFLVNVNRAATITVGDTGGNTIIQASSSPQAGTDGVFESGAWYVPNAKGGADTLAVTSTVSGNINVKILECKGAANGWTEDQYASSTGGTAAPADTGTTGVTTQANEVAIAWFSAGNGGLATTTGWNRIAAVDSFSLGEYMILAATGAQRATSTVTTGYSWTGSLDTFMPTPVAATGATNANQHAMGSGILNVANAALAIKNAPLNVK